jgi:hypothetical protein
MLLKRTHKHKNSKNAIHLHCVLGDQYLHLRIYHAQRHHFRFKNNLKSDTFFNFNCDDKFKRKAAGSNPGRLKVDCVSALNEMERERMLRNETQRGFYTWPKKRRKIFEKLNFSAVSSESSSCSNAVKSPKPLPVLTHFGYIGVGDQMSLLKNRPKCGLAHFCQHFYITFTAEKIAQNLELHTFVFKPKKAVSQ